MASRDIVSKVALARALLECLPDGLGRLVGLVELVGPRADALGVLLDELDAHRVLEAHGRFRLCRRWRRSNSRDVDPRGARDAHQPAICWVGTARISTTLQGRRLRVLLDVVHLVLLDVLLLFQVVEHVVVEKVSRFVLPHDNARLAKRVRRWPGWPRYPLDAMDSRARSVVAEEVVQREDQVVAHEPPPWM